MFSSLNTKLVLLVSGLLFVAISSVTFIIFLSSIERIEHNLGERALGIARTAATQIDGDVHERIAKNIAGAAKMPEFQQINEGLRRVKEANQLQTDIYTYIKTWWVETDYISFLASSSSEPFRPDKGQDMQEENRIPLIEGRDGYSDIFSTINGEWITGFAPIKTKDGKVAGVVEVALSTANEVAEAKQEFLRSALMAALLALVVGVILTFMVSRSITQPIKNLIGVTKQMAAGDLKARATLTGKDEVARLGGDFNDMAANLERSYGELENYSKNLENMVAERTAEVVAGKKKIQKILEHIEQGILTFDASMAIDDEFSAFLATFYQVSPNSIAGANAVEFVFPEAGFSADEMNQTRETLHAVLGESSIAWDFNSDHLPREAQIVIAGEPKIIALEWTPMVDDDDNTERLMLALRDLTVQRQLEAKMEADKAQNERMMTMISELIANKRSAVAKFLADAQRRLEATIAALDTSYDPQEIFRDLHTVKGGARLLKTKALMNAAHLAEEPFSRMLKGEELPADQIRESLLALQQEVHAYIRVLDEVLGSAGDSSGVSGPEVLAGVVGSQAVVLKKTIEDHGCSLGTLVCADHVIHWNPEVLSDIADMIMHGLNNGVDHGYLRPRQRGKTLPDVDLRVEARLERDQVVIDILDAGDGFDLEKIKQIAIEKGLKMEDSPEGILETLFSDGVSTAESVSESSGRGVGLPAVRQTAEKLGGRVMMIPNQPRGAHLIVTLPKEVATVQAVSVAS